MISSIVTSSGGFAISVTLNVIIPFLSSVFPYTVTLLVVDEQVRVLANVD